MNRTQNSIVGKATDLANEYKALMHDIGRHSSMTKGDEKRLDALEHDIRLIGETAAFFGGFEGMLSLNDAIVAAGGDSSTVNEAWAQICGWMP